MVSKGRKAAKRGGRLKLPAFILIIGVSCLVLPGFALADTENDGPRRNTITGYNRISKGHGKIAGDSG